MDFLNLNFESLSYLANFFINLLLIFEGGDGVCIKSILNVMTAQNLAKTPKQHIPTHFHAKEA